MSTELDPLEIHRSDYQSDLHLIVLSVSLALNIHQCPFSVCVSSEGSGKTMHLSRLKLSEPLLHTYVISTKISCWPMLLFE